MEKNKIKRYIKVLFGILFIIIILLIIILIYKKDKENNPNDNYIVPVTDEKVVQQVGSYNQYYTVTNILAKYYGYIGQKEENAVLQMLHPDYVKTHDVDKEINKIDSKDPIFYPEEMYVQTNDEVYAYYVYGSLKEYLNSEEYKEEYIKIYIDNNTESFLIFPIDKSTYQDSIQGKELLNLENVESNEYNKFSYLTISNKTKATYIFNNYKKIINEDIEKAYNLLDQEYRNKKFKEIDQYKRYLEDRAEIKNSILSKYSIREENGYTEYICIDQNGNKFIFKEDFVLNYTVMLDDYTIETDEFKEKYNLADVQGKVALNIQKFMQAIDLKDYNYAYNCLADGFKKNYFNTVDEFKKYAEENFYNKNLVTYKEFEEEGGLYKYTVTIENEEYQEEIKTKTFIVKLNEGTEFEMSFNID